MRESATSVQGIIDDATSVSSLVGPQHRPVAYCVLQLGGTSITVIGTVLLVYKMSELQNNYPTTAVDWYCNIFLYNLWYHLNQTKDV